MICSVLVSTGAPLKITYKSIDLREEKVESGDLVSLLGGPNGILLGEVIEVKESQDKVFKEARVRREIPLAEIVYVFVIK